MTTALFIGRFQPFHKAHLQDIKAILKECDEVIIAIGSSQHSDTKDNPFSVAERIEMIDKTIRILNGAIGRITSMHGDSVGYMNLKIHDLNILRAKLIKEAKE